LLASVISRAPLITSEKNIGLTGLQAAQLGLAAQLRALSEEMTAREYGALVDLHARFVERERSRLVARQLPRACPALSATARRAASRNERGSRDSTVAQVAA
jgi:hypothetical protein